MTMKKRKRQKRRTGVFDIFVNSLFKMTRQITKN